MKTTWIYSVCMTLLLCYAANAAEVTWDYADTTGWDDPMWQYLYAPASGTVNPDDYQTLTIPFSQQLRGGWHLSSIETDENYWCAFWIPNVVTAMHPSRYYDSILAFVIQETGSYTVDISTSNPGGSNGQVLYLQIDSDANQDYTNGFLVDGILNTSGQSQHFLYENIYLEAGDRVLLRVNFYGSQISDTTYINNFTLTTEIDDEIAIPEPLSIVLFSIAGAVYFRRKR